VCFSGSQRGYLLCGLGGHVVTSWWGRLWRGNALALSQPAGSPPMHLFIAFDFNSLGSAWPFLLLFPSESRCIPFSWSFHLELHLAFVSARSLPHEGFACLVIAQRQRRIQLRVFLCSCFYASSSCSSNFSCLLNLENFSTWSLLTCLESPSTYCERRC